ncbi:MAG: transcriptional repressor [Chloroflexi bacterium]|jgi:Fur family transcriptional regulator, ferric uptake regulator|nr:transcriptional repressor [Chloroflexota bacterium]MBT7079921.1 transcriptional repressor [Chloroflexota bacterium]MBT7290105.1 transcriptional repressor [Chloroflexota bacterium]
MQSNDTKTDKLPVKRNTSQRKLLLEILNKADGHLDADELFRRAKLQEPHISLSTVYRTLRLFKEMGVITERHFIEEHHHYEVKPKSDHHHLLCAGCGQVVEFDLEQISKIAKKIGLEHDFEVTGCDLHIEGYCPSCKKT